MIEQTELLTNFTPIERVEDFWVKRDDLYLSPGNVPGGKARTCYALAHRALSKGKTGLITAGSRKSPQVNIVAQIGKALGMKVRIHTPQGDPGIEVQSAIQAGAERISHKAGYNSVIVSKAKTDWENLGGEEGEWEHIPFGMECEEAVNQTASSFLNVRTIQSEINRIVVPVGSGMSLCGILKGIEISGKPTKVVGVCVGADPTKRLDKFFPAWKFFPLTLINSSVDYHKEIEAKIGEIELDPVYEAKCKEFLEPNDLLWIVGIRQTKL